jgi:hypothetical protein
LNFENSPFFAVEFNEALDGVIDFKEAIETWKFDEEDAEGSDVGSVQ